MPTTARLLQAGQRASFEVICAGEPIWRAASLDGDRLVSHPARAGILDIAEVLARRELRVGLATVLDDDRFGRALLSELVSLKVDVAGVTLGFPATDLVVVDAAGGRTGVVSERGTSRDFEVPSGWSSRVLLLSGLSPVTSKAAALCKAARRGRREGASVVLDVAGSLRQWAGHDPRMISMVIREADVVRCSLLDMAVLGTDSASVRRAMRPNSTLVVSDGASTIASGAFGEVRVTRSSAAPPDGVDACTASICAELARPSRRAESLDGWWHRVLKDDRAAR